MAYQTQNLVITAADYKTILTLNNGLTFPILTLEEVSMDASREEEIVYAIGQEEGIAVKRNAAKFTGGLTMQVGEFTTILKLAGLVEGTQIEGATLAITSLNPLGVQRVYNQININSEAISIKAKDKDSKVVLKWNALSVLGITV